MRPKQTTKTKSSASQIPDMPVTEVQCARTIIDMLLWSFREGAPSQLKEFWPSLHTQVERLNELYTHAPAHERLTSYPPKKEHTWQRIPILGKSEIQEGDVTLADDGATYYGLGVNTGLSRTLFCALARANGFVWRQVADRPAVGLSEELQTTISRLRNQVSNRNFPSADNWDQVMKLAKRVGNLDAGQQETTNV
jgi:hypothetical protein